MTITYFERVLITSSQDFPEYVGRIGIVLGVSSDADRVYGYAVCFESETEVKFFLPDELSGTNEFAEPTKIYGLGDRITVRVDGDRGSMSE